MNTPVRKINEQPAELTRPESVGKTSENSFSATSSEEDDDDEEGVRPPTESSSDPQAPRPAPASLLRLRRRRRWRRRAGNSPPCLQEQVPQRCAFFFLYFLLELMMQTVSSDFFCCSCCWVGWSLVLGRRCVYVDRFVGVLCCCGCPFWDLVLILHCFLRLMCIWMLQSPVLFALWCVCYPIVGSLDYR